MGAEIERIKGSEVNSEGKSILTDSEKKVLKRDMPEVFLPIIEDTIVEKKEFQNELSEEDKKNIEALRDGKTDYLKFLEYPREKRIRYCTKNNVNLSKIKRGEIKDIAFDFKFGGEKINEKIYLGTTAGQLLPEEVRSVKVGSMTYSRTTIVGEFFNDNGKRLTIHQGTSLKVGSFSTSSEINKQKQELFSDVNIKLSKNNVFRSEKNESKKISLSLIATEAAYRGIDIDFAMKLCVDIIDGRGNPFQQAARIENILTDFDRVRGMMSNGEHLDSGKNKVYSDSFTIKLLERLYSGEELNIQAKKHGIEQKTVQKIIHREGTRIHNRESMFFKKGIKGLLDFIAKAEGTNDNYNAVFRYKGMRKNRPDYKTMTIRQILVEQDNHRAHQRSVGRKNTSSAFGRYQVMGYSLDDKIKEGVVKLDDIFNEATQDKIAIAFLNQKGLQSFLSGRISRDKFQKRIAGTWRSLPKDSGGKGVNQGDAIGNHATVSNRELDRVLDNLKNTA